MDPHLQDWLWRLRRALPVTRRGPAVTRATEVEVIARLRDARIPVPGFVPTSVVAGIAAGTVRVGDIRSVRRHANVLSLKAARPLRRLLDASVPALHLTGLEIAPLNAGKPFDGSGVIIGIIDGDLDFAHRSFRRPDGRTRLAGFWNQRGGPSPRSPQPFGYGEAFDSAAIDAALNTANPAASLNYQVAATGHGTHVADIAAGNGSVTGRIGIAPGASLVFVQLDERAGTGHMGSSKQLLDAVRYVFDLAAAAGQPAVINISLGTHAGPHDGSTPVEAALDEFLAAAGRAIVIAAGNNGQIRNHASGAIPPAGAVDRHWRVPLMDQTPNELEVWYPSQSPLDVSLFSPAGALLGPVSPGDALEILDGAAPVGTIIHRPNDPNTPSNHVAVLLEPDAPNGAWTLRLTSHGEAVDFHAWIERDDLQPSRFDLADFDPKCSLNAIANGKRTIVVSSCDARDAQLATWTGSSRGPTRDGRHKPEICAPGVNVKAARAMDQSGLVSTKSGTSMAAPHVTGLVALMLQARPALTADQLRAALVAGAQSLGIPWDPQRGFGMVNGLAALNAALSAP